MLKAEQNVRTRYKRTNVVTRRAIKRKILLRKITTETGDV